MSRSVSDVNRQLLALVLLIAARNNRGYYWVAELSLF